MTFDLRQAQVNCFHYSLKFFAFFQLFFFSICTTLGTDSLMNDCEAETLNLIQDK